VGGSSRWNCRVYSGKAYLPAVLRIRECLSRIGTFHAGSQIPDPGRKIRQNEEILRKKQCVGEESGTGSVYRYTETGSETLKKTLAERHLRCCGSVTYWYGSDPDPRILIFSSVADKMPTKKKCFPQVFFAFTF
jgi:hypothetical protein